MLLSAKTAIIYGAGGAIGSASSRVFAREGAKVFLAGRRGWHGVTAAAMEDRGAGRATVAMP
jgi:NAD(P)-dependent dehydrogenase (short-subunit alcohol dehydrogenase family)